MSSYSLSFVTQSHIDNSSFRFHKINGYRFVPVQKKTRLQDQLKEKEVKTDLLSSN